MSVRRIGVLTGGGDCPGLNAVIRAVYRTATQQYGWDVLGIRDGFEGLIDLSDRSSHGNRWLTVDMVRGILPRGGTILGTSNKADPFRWVDPRASVKTETDVSDLVVKNFASLGLDGLVCVGGDGTMAIAHRLSHKGVPVVGIPKTIDNDLSATDVTFGFDTALGTAVDAIDKLHTTAESHDRVMFLEVMGRHAGWIALHSGLAGGADVILIPEIPYCLESVSAQIDRRRRAGRPFGIVVVAEGALPVGGAATYQESAELGRERRLGGAAHVVAMQLSQKIGLEHRVTVLGHLQRGGTPSAFDRLLGTRFGTTAVELLAQGRFDHMVCLRTPNVTAVPISEAIGRPNRVDPRGELAATARAIGISLGDPAELAAQPGAGEPPAER